MIIFTGVYSAKLMQQLEDFGDGEVFIVFAIALYFLLFELTPFYVYSTGCDKKWPHVG